jgi:hypothetical protein
LLTLLMGAASSPDPPDHTIRMWDARDWRLQSASLSRGTLTQCYPSLSLPMGGASSPDPTTAPLELGILRLVHKPASFVSGIPTRFSLLTTLLTCSTPSLGLMITLSHVPLLTQDMLVFLQSPTWVVGSGTQRVAYSTGCPTTVVRACIHLPS